MRQQTTMVAVISFLTVLRMLTTAQPSCNSRGGRLTFEKLPDMELQGYDEEPFRQRAPPLQVLERCREMVIQNRGPDNTESDYVSFDFVPGRRSSIFVSQPGAATDFDESVCYLTKEKDVTEKGRGQLATSKYHSHFKEICLSSSRVYSECPEKAYVFERWEGFRFDDRDGQEIYVSNRTECEDRCLNEVPFICRSASFNPKTGRCYMSRSVRRDNPEGFQAGDPSDVYLENVCLDENRRCEGIPIFIKESSTEFTGPFSMEVLSTATELECQRQCLTHRHLFCRSVQFDDRSHTCVISDEDSVSQPGDIRAVPGSTSVYSEVMCLNLGIAPPIVGSFERVRGQRLPLADYGGDSQARTLSACLEECLRMGLSKCMSLIYSRRTRTCRFGQRSRNDATARLEFDQDYDYYESILGTNLGGRETPICDTRHIRPKHHFALDRGNGFGGIGSGSSSVATGAQIPYGPPTNLRPFPPSAFPGSPFPGAPGMPGTGQGPSPFAGQFPAPADRPPFGTGADFPQGPGANFPPGGPGANPLNNWYNSAQFPSLGNSAAGSSWPGLSIAGGPGYGPGYGSPGSPGSFGSMNPYPDTLGSGNPYGFSNPSYGSSYPNYGASNPSYAVSNPSYGSSFGAPASGSPTSGSGLSGTPGTGTGSFVQGSGSAVYGSYGPSRTPAKPPTTPSSDSFVLAGPRQRIRYYYIRKIITVNGLKDCEKECSESRDFFCRAFNFRNFFQENCELSDQDSTTLDLNNPSYFDRNSEFDYYERRSLVASPFSASASVPATYPAHPGYMGGAYQPPAVFQAPLLPQYPGGGVYPGAGYPNLYPQGPGMIPGISGYPMGGFPYPGTLDVKQVCSEDGIEFTLTTPEGFYGRIYTYGYYDTCFFDGRGESVSVLRISRPDGFPRCGTLGYGAEYFTNIVVVQFNDFVQTGRDRKYNLTCTLFGPGETVVSSGVINTGTVPIPIDYLPAQNILASNIHLKILLQGRPVQAIAVGDPLTFRLESKRGFGYSSDIFASNVLAKDPYSGRVVQLIDPAGCPVDWYIFPALDRSREGDGLETQFNAFKIPDSNFLVFEATVRTCRGPCQPVTCNSPGRYNVLSYGRKRRELPGNQTDNEEDVDDSYTVTNVTNMDQLNMTQFDGDGEQVRGLYQVYMTRADLAASQQPYMKEDDCPAENLYFGLMISLGITSKILFVALIAAAVRIRRYKLIQNKNASADATTGTCTSPTYFNSSRFMPHLNTRFDDPSEPIYTDPSLFERSRSLRSLTVDSESTTQGSGHLGPQNGDCSDEDKP